MVKFESSFLLPMAISVGIFLGVGIALITQDLEKKLIKVLYSAYPDSYLEKWEFVKNEEKAVFSVYPLKNRMIMSMIWSIDSSTFF